MSKITLACLVAGFGLACADGPTAPESESALFSESSVVASVRIAPDSTRMTVGATLQAATIMMNKWGHAINGNVAWSTSDASVATVAAGLITAKAPGTALILATVGNIKGALNVRVVAAGDLPPTTTPPPSQPPPNNPPPAAIPTSIAIVSGNGQSVPAGRGIQADLVLRVTDASGNPFPNASVSVVAANGGTVFPALAITNSLGLIVVREWTLGPALGLQTLTARVTTGSSNPSVTATATGTKVRLVTFGDSNTDRGYLGRATTIDAVSYISVDLPRPAASAPNSATQLAGKIENLWKSRYSDAVEAVNHSIGGTTTGTVRTIWSSPSALTLTNGLTRFEGEVLGLGYPWSGGEVANLLYTGAILRTRAFTPTTNDFVYVSLGTNDHNHGMTPAQSVANLGAMIERWKAAGLPVSHFILTTLAPSAGIAPLGIPALNAAIRQLAASKGVHLIDLAAYVSADDGLTWKSDLLLIPDGTGAHYSESVRDWLANQVATVMGAATAPR